MHKSIEQLPLRALVVLALLTLAACSGGSTPDAGSAGGGSAGGGSAGGGSAGGGSAGGGSAGGGSAGGGGGSGGSGGGGSTDAGQHVAEQVVGAAGATITAPNGVTIEIPAGALPGDVTLTVDEVASAAAPAGATSVGATFKFGPEGQTFAVPVKVKLPWNGGNVPVVIAHSPSGGANWTTLTNGADSDATHVWAETSSFSWFQPVYYQGAPDAPIVLDNQYPVSPTAIALGVASRVTLRGTGFRTDTVVTFFKSGVTTTNATSVTLTPYGLNAEVPVAFTNTVGLITIQAKNPQASVGDSIGIYSIATPVSASLSPTTVSVRLVNGGYVFTSSTTINVTATDLPQMFSLCRVGVGMQVSPTAGIGAQTTAPTPTANGYSFVVTEIQLEGTYEVSLFCGAVRSNPLPLTFQLVP